MGIGTFTGGAIWILTHGHLEHGNVIQSQGFAEEKAAKAREESQKEVADAEEQHNISEAEDARIRTRESESLPAKNHAVKEQAARCVAPLRWLQPAKLPRRLPGRSRRLSRS